MKIAIFTLGCKVNQYETQAMEQELRRRGHVLVPWEEPADICIINTCSVTAVSGKKSRQAIRRARRTNPSAIIAVCGCYSQTNPEQTAALPVDLVAGTGGRIAFLDRLEELAARSPSLASPSVMPEPIAHPQSSASPLVMLEPATRHRDFERLPAGGLAVRTRAMLKIEDGCANFCAYCIIPYARGPVRSLPLTAATAETKRLAEEGYRELVLTGIEISSWGLDLGEGQSLTDLLEAVSAAAGSMRLRLGSLEPRTITEDFCRRCARLPNLCPHFHLSLQSGCDDTLQRMKRKYDTGRYKQSVDYLNIYFDRPAITTDLIVGFPGETEEEFSQTLDFITRCTFAEIHVFPYSIRPGTAAASMPQVPRAMKEERAAQAGKTAASLRRAYLEGCTGAVYPVLYEQAEGNIWRGHAPNYMPVFTPGEALHNQVRPTRITGCMEDGLLGELVE